ncbi:hypothetical protein ACHAPJ_007102 [Fusarium lateritium]
MQQHNSSKTVHDLVGEYDHIIKGKTILTTGVSPGSLGAVFVQAIAAATPQLLILAGRDTTKLQQTAETVTSKYPNIKLRILTIDLESLRSVRSAAHQVNSWDDVPKIDVLVNNAGVMATDFRHTEEGFESQFVVNHLGHFLFTNLIMDKLLAAEAPRVVTVASGGHRLGGIRWGDPHFSNGEYYNKWRAYGQSKTANMLFAIGLAKRLGHRGLQSYSIHPGLISGTALTSHLDFISAENNDFQGLLSTDRENGDPMGWKDWSDMPVEADVGTATHAFAAFSPNLRDHNGAYLEDCRLADPFTDTVRPWATSDTEAEMLWQLSEKLVGQRFVY